MEELIIEIKNLIKQLEEEAKGTYTLGFMNILDPRPYEYKRIADEIRSKAQKLQNDYPNEFNFDSLDEYFRDEVNDVITHECDYEKYSNKLKMSNRKKLEGLMNKATKALKRGLMCKKITFDDY